MSIPLYDFPPPDTTGAIIHDTGGWTVLSHPGTHPSGREGIVFDIPETTPDGNGCSFTLTQKGKELITLRGILYLHLPTGAGIVFDDFSHLKPSSTALPRLTVQGKVLMQDVP